MEKEYITFWTYLANFSEEPKRVMARSPKQAIERSTIFTDDRVRHLVFEVGGDLVHDGSYSDAPDVAA